MNWASISARDSPSPLGSVTNCARNQDAVTYRRKVVFWHHFRYYGFLLVLYNLWTLYIGVHIEILIFGYFVKFHSDILKCFPTDTKYFFQWPVLVFMQYYHTKVYTMKSSHYYSSGLFSDFLHLILFTSKTKLDKYSNFFTSNNPIISSGGYF